MRNATKILAGVFVVAAGGWFAGCNSTIDDGGGPAVVLEVENVNIPPVSSAVNTEVPGTCIYTLSNATATFKNKPKNAQASTSPFNDIILKNVQIAYTWDDGSPDPAIRTAGLGGSVPAAGTATGQFLPVGNSDLTTYNRAGKSATLTMTFNGVTVSGDDVSVTTGGTLQVNSCATTPVGACCLQGGGCIVQSQTSCVAGLGTYQGDNTSCLTALCN